MVYEGASCKNNYNLELFSKDGTIFQRQYVWQRSKYRRAFEFVGILNMPGIEKVLNMCEYVLE